MAGGAPSVLTGTLLARKGAASPAGFGGAYAIWHLTPLLALRALKRRLGAVRVAPGALALAGFAVAGALIWQLTGDGGEPAAVSKPGPASAAATAPINEPANAAPAAPTMVKAALDAPAATTAAPDVPTAATAAPDAPTAVDTAVDTAAAAPPPSETAPTAPLPARAVPAPEPPAVKAGYRVQFFALRSEASARRAWSQLEAKNKTLFAELRPTVVRTRLRVSGKSVYRLQVGDFATWTTAQNLCRKAKLRRLDCIVVRR